MSDKERLIVELEARINGFEKKMKKGEQTGTRSYKSLRRGSRSATRGMERDMLRSTTAINKALATTSMRIGGFGKAMSRGLAAGVVTAAFAGATSGIASMIKGIASIGDEAKRSGLSVKDFQEWKYVAEQNRIGLDQMVDGFKELNLRADEFVVTGKGPAAEAFERIGYTAQQLQKKLKDPSKLMLEIIGRMESLDTAAQIRVSDEIFGGSAGERFVELLGRGEGALRDTIRAANETGQVLDTAVIEKAVELDRRFAALQTRLGNFWKRFAVGAAGAVDDIVNLRRATDSLFAEHSQTDLEFGRLIDYVNTQSAALLQAANTLNAWGYDEMAAEIIDTATEMRNLTGELEDGTISAEEFEQRMGDAATTAKTAFDEIDAIDKAEFSNVITGINGLITRLGTAVTRARELRASLPGGGIAYAGRGGDPRTQGGTFADWDIANSTPNAPPTSPRPSRPPPMIHEYGDPLPSGSSGGGGGGSSRLTDFERKIQAIKDETSALEMESVALVAVAVSGKKYGDAIEFARKKAELLHAAQKSGKTITPELRAEIDALAEAYVVAGASAEQAAEKLEDVEVAAERGADAISDIFLGVLDGSRSAKDAVSALIKEIAQIQLRKALGGLATGGGIFGALGSLLGFASGGYTGNGAKHQPAGIVHKGEYVMNAAATRRIGVGNLAAMQAGQAPNGGGGTSTVLIELSPELVGSIIKQAGDNSVE